MHALDVLTCKLTHTHCRHALHAGHLGFVHPAREKFVEWLEPIPPDMLRE
jgi:23S rRNA-/tRNA-specific pseudouridylate synthase